jgi:hypothetical protein
MNRKFDLSELENRQESPDDLIYYNIVIPNNTVDLLPATYNTITQIPILTDPSQYFVTISRFSIAGSGVPIFYFRDNGLDPSDPLYTSEYVITLSYNGTDFKQYVKYDINIDTVNPSLRTVYSYKLFILYLNRAFQLAFNDLKTAFPLAPPTEAPYMQYDASGNLCTLYTQTSYDDTVTLSPTIEIYMNNILYYFWDNFPVQRVGNQLANFKDYKFLIRNFGSDLIQSDVNNPLITSTNQYYRIVQDYSSLYYWNDAKTITFKSCLFPTAGEYAPTTQNQTVTSEKILTDFEPIQSLSDPSGFRGVLQYSAQGVYRLINLTSNSPLKNLDLQITYKTELGEEYPLLIPRNQSVTVKLIFIKKSLYKSTYSR